MLTREMDKSLQGRRVKCISPFTTFGGSVSVVGEAYAILSATEKYYDLYGRWEEVAEVWPTLSLMYLTTDRRIFKNDPGWDDIEASFMLLKAKKFMIGDTVEVLDNVSGGCKKYIGQVGRVTYTTAECIFVDLPGGNNMLAKLNELQHAEEVEAKEHNDILGKLKTEALEIFQELNWLHYKRR